MAINNSQYNLQWELIEDIHVTRHARLYIMLLEIIINGRNERRRKEGGDNARGYIFSKITIQLKLHILKNGTRNTIDVKKRLQVPNPQFVNA